MSNISFSVVIPTHKRPELLRRAVESVLSQTRLPKEIIVVDDASDVETEGVCTAFGADIVRYVCNKGKGGASSARNLGVTTAVGDYVAFLDDDDAFVSSKLDRIYQLASVYTDVDFFYHAARINMVNEQCAYISKPGDYHTDELFRMLLVSNVIGGTPMVVAKRETLLEIGLFDPSLPALEDYELWLRAAKANKVFHRVPDVLTNCFYYTGKKSVSKMLSSNLEALDSIRTRYADGYNSLESKELNAHSLWEKRMIMHKSLLNNDRRNAWRAQCSVFFKMPSCVNLFILTLIPFSLKTIFKLRARFSR